MTAQTPWILWVFLTAGSVAVGGAMLVVAFAVVNRRQKRQRGFEVTTTTTGSTPAVLPERENDHG
jgi:hypothetical protein